MDPSSPGSTNFLYQTNYCLLCQRDMRHVTWGRAAHSLVVVYVGHGPHVEVCIYPTTHAPYNLSKKKKVPGPAD